jgi:precorrin-8X/cobalt-precorrin-8 methylmutase
MDKCFVPEDIEKHSLEIIEGLLPPLPYSKDEREVVKRIVHAAGDPDIAHLVRIHPQAISAALSAIYDSRPIFTDVKMVASGISRRMAQEFDCSIHCALNEPKAIVRSQEENITRAAAAIHHLGTKLSGAIVVIGNAPTALFALLELMDGGILPALIVGMPVGFVGAEESKAELVKRSIPYITVEGTRGGSALSVAAMNALLKLAEASKGKA